MRCGGGLGAAVGSVRRTPRLASPHLEPAQQWLAGRQISLVEGSLREASRRSARGGTAGVCGSARASQAAPITSASYLGLTWSCDRPAVAADRSVAIAVQWCLQVKSGGCCDGMGSTPATCQMEFRIDGARGVPVRLIAWRPGPSIMSKYNSNSLWAACSPAQPS